MAAAVKKTNAMRELERAGIAYTVHTYVHDDDDFSGARIAAQLGEDPDQVFKTLVTVSPEGAHVVCCIPVDHELDLKRAAKAAGVKALSMLPLRALTPTTGYVRGGCSPVGMKKRFPTVIDETCQLFDTIMISGGKRGLQLELEPDALVAFCGARIAAITQEG
ncbi:MULTISPECIES: Cys-tRNA(Pro) deacylase [Collinsella]|uniref:Cys-tRNA(Pro) deacylase n=1 Tax=Collinsella TaxID=102106 RepID=UPI000B39467E|nr:MULTISPECIES: Cys-tRNA(Pro) deacylase [Collinsella]MBM6908477.1 Cys-tRNA(Pro) deacylase [Collinsella intestinalis]MBM6942956.1 Cys-tRNA(Pro) deacylase [Collinsella intestinalis]OUO64883.1 aminoacyl-tRNA deacylase [Collinsella sp. An268]